MRLTVLTTLMALGCGDGFFGKSDDTAGTGVVGPGSCHVEAESGSQWQSIHMFFSPAAPEVEVARVQLYVAVRAMPS